MIRELVLVTADLKATPWGAAGPPPSVPLPKGLQLRVYDESSPPNVTWTGGVAQGAAVERFAAGDRCIAAIDQSNRVVAEMWCADRVCFIEWIGCNVTPPPHHVLLYNAWVAPAHRGHGVQWALAAAACGDIVKRGKHGMHAGVERAEYAPFARKYAAMGLAVIEPVASLWAVSVFGRTFSFRIGPPGALEPAAASARALFARQGRA